MVYIIEAFTITQDGVKIKAKSVNASLICDKKSLNSVIYKQKKPKL